MLQMSGELIKQYPGFGVKEFLLTNGALRNKVDEEPKPDCARFVLVARTDVDGNEDAVAFEGDLCKLYGWFEALASGADDGSICDCDPYGDPKIYSVDLPNDLLERMTVYAPAAETDF